VPSRESVTHIRSLPAPTLRPPPQQAALASRRCSRFRPGLSRVRISSRTIRAANGAGHGRYIDWVMKWTAKPQYAIHDVVVRIVFARISFHAPTRCRMACRSDPTTRRE